MKVLILGDEMYGKPWRETFADAQCVYLNTSLNPHPVALQNYDAIQFTGGVDVSPALYGELNTASSNCEHRDLWETHLFLEAKRLLIPCFGICRGSQFLRVMCGGRLCQHFGGHGISGTHAARFNGYGALDNRELQITSTHHQHAIVDPGKFYEFLTADDGTVVEGWIHNHMHHYVYAVQYHPEYMDVGSQGFQLYQDVLNMAIGQETVHWDFA